MNWIATDYEENKVWELITAVVGKGDSQNEKLGVGGDFSQELKDEFSLRKRSSDCCRTQVYVPDYSEAKESKMLEFEGKRFIAKAKQEERAAHAQKGQTSLWFWGKSFYRQNLGGGLQGMWPSWLVGGEVTGWCSRNLVISLLVPRSLGSSACAQPEVTSLHLGGAGALVSIEELIDLYQIMCIPWGGTRTLL